MMIPHEIQNATDPEGLMRSIASLARTMNGTVEAPVTRSGIYGDHLDFIRLVSDVIENEGSSLFEKHFPDWASRKDRQDRNLSYALSFYSAEPKIRAGRFRVIGIRYVMLRHTPKWWKRV